MVSLVDIVPQTRTVELSVGAVKLRALSLTHIAALLIAFPELRKLWAGGAPELDFGALIATVPDAIGDIIAMAAGETGEGAAAAITNALSVDDTAECLIAIRELTMPGGIDPFVGKVTRLLGGAAPLSGREADTNMPQQPSN